MTKVLTKVAHWNPKLDFDAALESLPEDADLAVLKERIDPHHRPYRRNPEDRRPVPGLGTPFLTAAAGS